MKELLILFCKGILIGLAKMIPGASGALLSISLGLYEKGVKSLRYFHQDIKSNTYFLGSIGLGILVSIVTMSKFLLYLLNFWYLPTMLLFLGLMIGGIPSLIKKISITKHSKYPKWLVGVLIVLIILIWSSRNILSDTTGFWLYWWIGIIETITMVVPGISGTAMLLLLGGYDYYLSMLSNIILIFSDINYFNNILFFVSGALTGMSLGIWILDYTLKKYERYLYVTVLFLMSISIIFLFLETLKQQYQLLEIIISIILLVIGYKITKILSIF